MYGVSVQYAGRRLLRWWIAVSLLYWLTAILYFSVRHSASFDLLWIWLIASGILWAAVGAI